MKRTRAQPGVGEKVGIPGEKREKKWERAKYNVRKREKVGEAQKHTKQDQKKKRAHKGESRN